MPEADIDHLYDYDPSYIAEHFKICEDDCNGWCEC